MHAGPVGAGAVLKLAVNLPLMIYWQALGEQLAMCKDLTIDPAELLDFLVRNLRRRDRAQAAHAGHRRAAEKASRPSIATFTLDGGIKDVKRDAGGGQAPRPRTAAAAADARLLQGGASAHIGGDDEVSNVSAYWAGRQNRN